VNIYLVRHGEAVSAQLNPERPLTRAGQEEVERVAQMAAAKNIQVSSIFHSGVLRAKQTAEILADHLRLTDRVQQLSGLLPEDDPAIAKAELQTAEQPLMLVGHLPHLGRLAALLTSGTVESEVVEFAPATLVCCRQDGSKWQIAWTLTPRPV
jgi:phosphohistidine phosphatase